MIVFTEEEIEKIVTDDVPYFDLTTTILDIGDKEGIITYTARHEMIICCTEEVKRIFKKFDIETEIFKPSGIKISRGETFLLGKGKAESLHKIWKATQSLLEYACGIATKTYKLVSLARKVNPDVSVVTTRKTFPLGKKICIKAILAGGALPHRLGLSETILVFGEHLNFYGGYERFFQDLEKIKKRAVEKKITVEVKDMELALKAIEAGVDILQLDKFSIEEVQKVVNAVRQKQVNIKVAAAGGINESNIADYAATGVDIIVLTCAYFGKPADIKVKLGPIL
ncbi:modD protein [Thermodesulfatator indicus DSM 15286]|uniref:Putative pyrophosphorylase ModD n=1 Tax=Thermodesulfatator indicus (strain DSM 15286 / JCM 11887 / CIR29812) TaxID=667014 RepID=F8AB04_THEID|nr:ModD protein [Thermodesulfatator indicus]AEH44370.1 modD protein [Thermodesulfatator indicus DSM 15286]